MASGHELSTSRSIPASVSDLLHSPTHQAGKHRHHHFGLDFHQVFGESVDTRPDLPRHRNCVPGDEVDHIRQLVQAERSVLFFLQEQKKPQ